MCIRDRLEGAHGDARIALGTWPEVSKVAFSRRVEPLPTACLLYTSDAADERSSVDLGGRRIIKKKKHINDLQKGDYKEKEVQHRYK